MVDVDKLKALRREAMEQMAFEMFAQAYPHEAAEADWPAFVAFTRSKCPEPDISEDEVRRLLRETEGVADGSY